jgi:hypothetical protein
VFACRSFFPSPRKETSPHPRSTLPIPHPLNCGSEVPLPICLYSAGSHLTPRPAGLRFWCGITPVLHGQQLVPQLTLPRRANLSSAGPAVALPGNSCWRAGSPADFENPSWRIPSPGNEAAVSANTFSRIQRDDRLIDSERRRERPSPPRLAMRASRRRTCGREWRSDRGRPRTRSTRGFPPPRFDLPLAGASIASRISLLFRRAGSRIVRSASGS